MTTNSTALGRLLHDLRERAKELNCLYEVQELLNRPNATIDDICQGIIQVIPPGWQYPDVCQAEVAYARRCYRSDGFKESDWQQSADIVVQDETVGMISVYYTEERPPSDEGPFLKEERKLINTIAEQLGFYILHEQLKSVFREQMQVEDARKSDWTVLLDLLRRTDPDLLMRITRKMINYLSWSGYKDAEKLLEAYSLSYGGDGALNGNRPATGPTAGHMMDMSDEVFDVASRHLSRDAILNNIQEWSQEDRSRFLVKALLNRSSSLAEIGSAIERFQLLRSQAIDLTPSRDRWVRTALVRRLLSEDPLCVEVAQRYLIIDDFEQLIRRHIYPVDGRGRLGGKAVGLILAEQILRHSSEESVAGLTVKTPKTWYLTSDAVFRFMSYNDLDDMVEQKYREVSHVRQEYPFIIHVFKNSPFPPELVKGLSLALDDFAEVPLIIRSSSLLEDQAGATFAGKYKSLFIANRGTKEERLAELMDAIAEVFASLFAPDPIEYRLSHNLLDHNEEMGILIQEVVGRPIGHYYFPAFAGVAFSQNDFRWSSRIRRDDGLMRLVPGLGTRAVDRLSDDYPVLIAPGQPRLRVNVTPDEVLRYSPKKIDVINLEKRAFETVDIRQLLNELGRNLPLWSQLVSLMDAGLLRLPTPVEAGTESGNVVVTFEGLFSRTPFLKQVQFILARLQEVLGQPVDIEFAHDGQDFYLLQCRTHTPAEESRPASIPSDLPADRIIFTASRFVSNGFLPAISHIVYVDPLKYAELGSLVDLLAVGRAISLLNQTLPRRKFLLMGPGRWGSRGDIRLGVSVTYSDISNTAMLIEIARKQEDYAPEPSFGTHFFQDLVEAAIRYLPLYPDEPGVIFNETFLSSAENLLPSLTPDFASIANVVRVIDVPASTGGQILQIRMNADAEQAIAFLTNPLTPQENEQQGLGP
jgi:pyruvate,water dikinase